MRAAALPSTVTFAALFSLLCVTGSVAAPGSGLAAQPPQPDSAILIGAGDIASCDDLSGAQGTAAIIDSIPGTVMAVGDLAYPEGAAETFARCYDTTWGKFKARTRPAPGNHEFRSSGATPYFDYFGPPAGDPRTGYYSYELGTWHVVVINSECGQVGGCNAGSAEERWLRADLAAHPATCTIAYWHKPLFSSGNKHGNYRDVAPLWQALYDAGADVVVNGHDHDYERFAPQTPAGAPDSARGIREFVVGTGGKNLRSFNKPKPNSEVRSVAAFGVLKLTLKPTSYTWEFIPVSGKTFRDSGSGTCH